MSFKESYKMKGYFKMTMPNGTISSAKYSLIYRFTDKMKVPSIKIRGNPDNEVKEEFIAKIKERYNRNFSIRSSGKIIYLDNY